MIPVGSVAPDFRLQNQYGQPFVLSSYRGQYNVLLVFLPAAFTPICTNTLPIMAHLYERFLNETKTLPAVITVDNTHSNLAWSQSCGSARVPILSDFYPHGEVGKAYGCLAADGLDERCTVIVDKQGVVRYSMMVDRFRQQNVPELLSIASQINGGRAILNVGGVITRPALPVLYVSSSCPHCWTVRNFIMTSGMGPKIIVREVDKDQVAMNELLSLDKNGATPLLHTPQGDTVSGDEAIIRKLR